MPQYLSIVQASHELPHRPHKNTIRRWMISGLNGVRLRSVRFGGKRLTTSQWVAEFVTAVQQASPDSCVAHLEANAKLDAMGV